MPLNLSYSECTQHDSWLHTLKDECITGLSVSKALVGFCPCWSDMVYSNLLSNFLTTYYSGILLPASIAFTEAKQCDLCTKFTSDHNYVHNKHMQLQTVMLEIWMQYCFSHGKSWSVPFALLLQASGEAHTGETTWPPENDHWVAVRTRRSAGKGGGGTQKYPRGPWETEEDDGNCHKVREGQRRLSSSHSATEVRGPLYV